MGEPSKTSVDGGVGHLAVHVEGMHAPELTFSFERPQSRVGVGGAFGAHVLFVAVAIFIATYAPTPSVSAPPQREALPSDIVWLDTPGPGGGGGGGGNQMPEPPKKAEIPGKEAISVPVKPPLPDAIRTSVSTVPSAFISKIHTAPRSVPPVSSFLAATARSKTPSPFTSPIPTSA